MAAAVLLLGKPALAQRLSLSAGVFSVQSEYRGSDARVLPMPVVHYEGDRFFLKNTEAGVWLWNDGVQKISLGATLLPQYFRASKSDDPAMKRLDNRNIIVLGTLGYELNTSFGSLRAKASGDITGTSDGFLASIDYAYPLNAGPLTVIPTGGVLFSSANFNDYYYGISRGESVRSGLSRYSPDASATPFLRRQRRLRPFRSLESVCQLENHLPRQGNKGQPHGGQEHAAHFRRRTHVFLLVLPA